VERPLRRHRRGGSGRFSLEYAKRAFGDKYVRQIARRPSTISIQLSGPSPTAKRSTSEFGRAWPRASAAGQKRRLRALLDEPFADGFGECADFRVHASDISPPGEAKTVAMQLGLMNHPARPVVDEVRAIAAAGFEFVDLTLEPPGAWPVDGAELGRLLRELGLTAVGHTSPHLPIASPFDGLRERVHEILRQCFAVFAELGAELVNVHPDSMPSVIPRDEVTARNTEAVASLADDAAAAGVRLMVENMGRSFATADQLRPLFDAAPRAQFHLDVGHAHLGRRPEDPNRTAELVDAFGDRLAHVHINDNLGLDDLHLPLGAGSIDWPDVARALRRAGYDRTVTIEIFSREPAYIETSVRLWREWWASA
jgi:sugar phosphate isomerase/epimerase